MSEPMSKGPLPTDAMIEAANDLLAPIYAECGRLITDHPGMDITPHLPPLEARLFDALWEATYPSASPPADIEGLVERLLPRSKKTLAELIDSLRSGHAYDPEVDANGVYMLANKEGEDAADLITALLADRERMTWQPIKTVPKDGIVLVFGRWASDSEFPEMPWWNIGNCYDIGVYGDWNDDTEPTHWMPLPAALQPTGGSGDE
jgi:hypothetical protein